MKPETKMCASQLSKSCLDQELSVLVFLVFLQIELTLVLTILITIQLQKNHWNIPQHIKLLTNCIPTQEF